MFHLMQRIIEYSIRLINKHSSSENISCDRGSRMNTQCMIAVAGRQGQGTLKCQVNCERRQKKRVKLRISTS